METDPSKEGAASAVDNESGANRESLNVDEICELAVEKFLKSQTTSDDLFKEAVTDPVLIGAKSEDISKIKVEPIGSVASMLKNIIPSSELEPKEKNVVGSELALLFPSVLTSEPGKPGFVFSLFTAFVKGLLQEKYRSPEIDDEIQQITAILPSMQSAAAKEIVAQDPTVPIKSGAVAGNPLIDTETKVRRSRRIKTFSPPKSKPSKRNKNSIISKELCASEGKEEADDWNPDDQSKPRKKPRGRPRTKNKSRERHNTASEAKLKINDDKIHHLVTSTLDNPMNEERKESDPGQSTDHESWNFQELSSADFDPINDWNTDKDFINDETSNFDATSTFICDAGGKLDTSEDDKMDSPTSNAFPKLEETVASEYGGSNGNEITVESNPSLTLPKNSEIMDMLVSIDSTGSSETETRQTVVNTEAQNDECIEQVAEKTLDHDEEGEEGQQNKEKEEDLLKQLFQYLPDELQNQFLEMYKSMGLEKAAANFASIIDQQE